MFFVFFLVVKLYISHGTIGGRFMVVEEKMERWIYSASSDFSVESHVVYDEQTIMLNFKAQNYKILLKRRGFVIWLNPFPPKSGIFAALLCEILSAHDLNSFQIRKLLVTHFKTYRWDDLGATAEMSMFAPQGGVAEIHVMLHVENRRDSFSQQLERLHQAQKCWRQMVGTEGWEIVFRRYFLSDSANQAALMGDLGEGAVSVIQQPPLDGSKVALWVYAQKGTAVTYEKGATMVEHNGYRHLWHAGLHSTKGDSAEQTEQILHDYEQRLTRAEADLYHHCRRTWFFVRDVDTQYAGMVRARLENFHEQGLTPDTHYISSTGIGGLPADTRALLQLDAYALTGMDDAQQHFLRALTHLNPTIEYGVTFERGTLLEYGDRAHAIISGTASIDHKGRVVHVGDVSAQTLRMWENVEALLAEADMTMERDVQQMLVYLRDVADYETVRELFEKRFPNIPKMITLAPVCRPEWLIEMECWAVSPRSTSLRPF